MVHTRDVSQDTNDETSAISQTGKRDLSLSVPWSADALGSMSYQESPCSSMGMQHNICVIYLPLFIPASSLHELIPLVNLEVNLVQ
jgi:hypothetical protein